MSAFREIQTGPENQPATAGQTPQVGPWRSILARLGRALPPLVVFFALGGLLFWGHSRGWDLGSFSALAGQSDKKPDDWCEEHDVPESQCVECNPALLPRTKTFGWCSKHGVHDCPLCHPEVAQLQAPPRITPADLERAERALALAERPANSRKCKLHERRVQFVSAQAVQKAGIDVEPVTTDAVTESVTGNGEITYDRTRVARLSARVPGTVFRVYKETGEWVQQGDVLALVDAAEVGKAKSEFLQALAQVRLRSRNYDSLTASASSGAIPQRSLREAESALRESRIRLQAAQQALANLGMPVPPAEFESVSEDQLAGRLQFLGLPAALVRTFDAGVTTANLLPVVAHLDGVVLTRTAVAGEVVDTSKVLFETADVRQVWLTLDLPVEEAKRVQLGQQVHFHPDGSAEALGKITWISTAVDARTRTVKVRATLDNADGRLRANTFGSGQVILREEPQATMVPSSAVQWEGCCHIVFVRDKDFDKNGPTTKVFHVRTVRLGARTDQETEIIAGVLPGEVVATQGSAALRAELLKDNLGEG